jgi:hypothetical protein
MFLKPRLLLKSDSSITHSSLWQRATPISWPSGPAPTLSCCAHTRPSRAWRGCSARLVFHVDYPYWISMTVPT